MVKVRKPNPKSIKNNAPGIAKNPQMKITNVNSPKKSVGRNLEIVKNEVAKDVQQKSADLNKSKKTQEKLKDASPNKKPNVAQVQEMAKKMVLLKNVAKIVRNEISKDIKQDSVNKNKKFMKPQEKLKEKKKPNVAQVQEMVKEVVILKKPVVKEVQDDSKKTVQKKKPATKVGKKSVLATKRKESTLPAKSEKSKLAAKGKKSTLAIKVESKNRKNGCEIDQNENSKEDTGKVISPKFEPVDFDEDKFKDIVSLENIKKFCSALKVLVEEEVSKKKTSIFSDYRYYLNVSSYKIPNCPKRMVKLNLKHSLVDTKTDDIVLIVPDLQRGAKVDYEPTIQHYEDLLRENGVENIKIVPFNQLRREFTSYEAKRKFANTYDYFLCDGRIVGHVSGFLGKHFQKPRTTIHAVHLDNPKTYKSDIEHALKRTSYRQLHKGDMISIPVGTDIFTINQLGENIEKVIEQLKTIFPGGYANIRNMHIKIDIIGTSSIPLYLNLAGAPAEVPNIVGEREQKMLKLKKQANDILSKFSMSKAGDFIKLNKTQAKRKQDIRESRTALLSKENVEVDENDSELNPVKKAKSDNDESEDGSENSNQDDSEISDE